MQLKVAQNFQTGNTKERILNQTMRLFLERGSVEGEGYDPLQLVSGGKGKLYLR
jgi:hypothetical protein